MNAREIAEKIFNDVFYADAYQTREQQIAAVLRIMEEHGLQVVLPPAEDGSRRDPSN